MYSGPLSLLNTDCEYINKITVNNVRLNIIYTWDYRIGDYRIGDYRIGDYRIETIE